ncbi:hypothetical protein HHI36_003892, partial [Cryptolaemus montrouzieri]
MMFDNLLVNIKNHANNFGDTLKNKSRKISYNINILKNQITNRSKSTYYTITKKEDNEYYNDYLSPRAYSMTTFSINGNMNDTVEWLPYMPPSFDENNIVDRFIKVITINDNETHH